MKLRLTLRAEADIDEIAAHVSERSPQGALRVEAELLAAFRLISVYPLVGHEVRPGIRRFALPRYPYLVFYGVDQNAEEISVFTVRHAKRRDED